VPPWACLPGRRLGPLHRLLPRIYIYIWPYSEKYYELDLEKYSARPITLSHAWWNFDELFVASKAWDAGDADCGVARANRVARARAIGAYLRGQFLVKDL
jgi:hypothetical protein